MGLIDDIKDRIKGSGKSRSEIFYLKDGEKKRVRFLTELDKGSKILFHDKWGEFQTPCLRLYGRECEYCSKEDARHRDNYAWPVYVYEDKAVRIFMYKANESTPVPDLVAMNDVYGTIMDRDYVVARSGTKLDTSYSVVPMDKSKFKIKAKPLTSKEMLEKIFDSFGNKMDLSTSAKIDTSDDGWDDDEEEDDVEEEELDEELDEGEDENEEEEEDEDEDEEEDLDEEDFFDDGDDEEDEKPKKKKDSSKSRGKGNGKKEDKGKKKSGKSSKNGKKKGKK